MIRINLLPDEYKKTKGKGAPFEFNIAKMGPKVLQIAGCSLAALIALHLVLCLFIFLRGSSLKKLDYKWRLLQPKKIEMDHLRADSSAAGKIIAPIKQLVESRMTWADKLNKLSELITPGIWFSRISLEKEARDPQKGTFQKILNIEGFASSAYGDETALVGRFIKALQEDGDFFKDFSAIKLGPMEKQSSDDISTMHFKISCFLK